MRDRQSGIWRGFAGLYWYSPDKSFRVRGSYVPHDKPCLPELSNSVGDTQKLRTTGSVALSAKDEGVRMTAIDYDDRLWFVFRDLTSSNETYTATRLLYVDAPGSDGWTTATFAGPTTRPAH